MPNDPRHSRLVTVEGHTGTLVIDTHVDQPEAMADLIERCKRYVDKPLSGTMQSAIKKMVKRKESDTPMTAGIHGNTLQGLVDRGLLNAEPFEVTRTKRDAIRGRVWSDSETHFRYSLAGPLSHFIE